MTAHESTERTQIENQLVEMLLNFTPEEVAEFWKEFSQSLSNTDNSVNE